MKEKLYQNLIELSNGQRSSKILQSIAQSALSKNFIRSYSNLYGIDLQEVSKSPKEFTSLHDFFVRELKTEVRPVDERPDVLVSPVDAKIEVFGDVSDRTVFTVKDKPYSLTDLLGNEQQALRYKNGKYIVFYLSPADYHRIHSPVDGEIVRQYVLGNKSYPVNQTGLQYGKKPISHNYRMISEIRYGKQRHAAFIKVGATFVNSIQLTNTSAEWKKGQEVGYFSFGSTVVMFFEQETIEFHDHVTGGAKIKMGEAFATML